KKLAGGRSNTSPSIASSSSTPSPKPHASRPSCPEGTSPSGCRRSRSSASTAPSASRRTRASPSCRASSPAGPLPGTTPPDAPPSRRSCADAWTARRRHPRPPTPSTTTSPACRGTSSARGSKSDGAPRSAGAARFRQHSLSGYAPCSHIYEPSPYTRKPIPVQRQEANKGEARVKAKGVGVLYDSGRVHFWRWGHYTIVHYRWDMEKPAAAMDAICTMNIPPRIIDIPS
ncbi:hypothetical protein TCAP_00024, partial [Tolypocladium capitatum]